jgi:imidazolonepropionase-like amidohydrolase
MIPAAAKLLGVDQERGAIRPQLAADLIASAANPLEDITALKTRVIRDEERAGDQGGSVSEVAG